MNINEAFPSKYVKAADLGGRTPTVTIGQAIIETIGTDRKLILYFYGKEKGFVLNKTNANAIAEAYGPNTDAWIGQKIVLFEAMVDFKGKNVPAIRLRAAIPVQAPQQETPAPFPEHPPQQIARPQMYEMAPPNMNDEIPF